MLTWVSKDTCESRQRGGRRLNRPILAYFSLPCFFCSDPSPSSEPCCPSSGLRLGLAVNFLEEEA